MAVGRPEVVEANGAWVVFDAVVVGVVVVVDGVVVVVEVEVDVVERRE